MLKIYIRKDLNMRKGKMAAQSAHAIMKLFFELMHIENDKFLISKENVKLVDVFLKEPKIEIVYVNSEEDLFNSFDKLKPFSVIVDSGRTEFNGVKTVTCGAQGIFSKGDLTELVVPHNYGQEIKSKQVFVFNKSNDLSKENACKLAVITCLMDLRNKLINKEDYFYYDLSVLNEFNSWIMNAFAKISLSVNTTEELEEIIEKLKNEKISFQKYNIDNSYCICIEAKEPINIDPITGSLKLI
jgi:PTH2 family peptidyl-tRNA hydrolase